MFDLRGRRHGDRSENERLAFQKVMWGRQDRGTVSSRRSATSLRVEAAKAGICCQPVHKPVDMAEGCLRHGNKERVAKIDRWALPDWVAEKQELRLHLNQGAGRERQRPQKRCDELLVTIRQSRYFSRFEGGRLGQTEIVMGHEHAHELLAGDAFGHAVEHFFGTASKTRHVPVI